MRAVSVTFDPTAHRYFLDDGREVPGLSRVMQQAGLVDTSFYRVEHSARGSALHKACEIFGRSVIAGDRGSDGWGQLDIETVDPSCRPELDAYRAFLDDTPECQLLETERLISDGNTATHIDARITWRGRTGPLELKTGVPARWHRVQLAQQMRLTNATQGWLMYLSRKRPTPEPLDGLVFVHALRAFHSAFNLFQWRLLNGDRTCFDDHTERHTADYGTPDTQRTA